MKRTVIPYHSNCNFDKLVKLKISQYCSWFQCKFTNVFVALSTFHICLLLFLFTWRIIKMSFQLYDVIITPFLPHLYVKETIAEKIQLNFYSVSQQLVAGIIKYISIIPVCIMSGHHYKWSAMLAWHRGNKEMPFRGNTMLTQALSQWLHSMGYISCRNKCVICTCHRFNWIKIRRNHNGERREITLLVDLKNCWDTVLSWISLNDFYF